MGKARGNIGQDHSSEDNNSKVLNLNKPSLAGSARPCYNTVKKTKVAAETGEYAVYPELKGPTHSGWCEGTLMKFQPKEAGSYLVRWATKPYSEISVTEGELTKLVNNHVFCTQYDIFAGIVGTIILWPCVDETLKNILRYVRVMRLYKDLNKYKLHYRDGRAFYVTPQHLDSAVTRHEHLLLNREVVFDYTESTTRWVSFTGTQIAQKATREKGNYVYVKIYGSDFSDTNSDTAKDVPTTSDTSARAPRRLQTKSSKGHAVLNKGTSRINEALVALGTPAGHVTAATISRSLKLSNTHHLSMNLHPF
jgi:hypothetical protein